ncbi:hypothetical protein [Citrobacter arsenatis]|uniref:hypothetical protein n=1 Tax=Citrobacter arsenatis TaxID=2546350 RepID=UPI00300E163A
MTQPARKKEAATHLELLEAELIAARKVTARCRTAMEKAEKRLDAAEASQADVQYRYDCALVASWGDTPDWLTLLDGDESRSSVMYELARDGLERLGLGISMINMETGQREISICQPRRDKFALSLMVDARTQSVSVMKRVYGREKERTGFSGLEAALRYIRSIHSDTSIEAGSMAT